MLIHITGASGSGMSAWDSPLRQAWLRKREWQRFGAVDEAFIEWAGQYDDGPTEGRSLAPGWRSGAARCWSCTAT